MARSFDFVDQDDLFESATDYLSSTYSTQHRARQNSASDDSQLDKWCMIRHCTLATLKQLANSYAPSSFKTLSPTSRPIAFSSRLPLITGRTFHHSTIMSAEEVTKPQAEASQPAAAAAPAADGSAAPEGTSKSAGELVLSTKLTS